MCPQCPLKCGSETKFHDEDELRTHLMQCALIKVKCKMCHDTMQKPQTRRHTCTSKNLIKVNKSYTETIG